MDAGKRNEIEAKLRKMLELDSKSKSSSENRNQKQAVCNVIRRRKGEQDKRIFVLD
ncbi:Uncharacterized protein dnl_44830 [Desulfonema limicola]|uniref:Uncharacterized protein n=1 Tax=Desulfonema limicola TaxID=45656 RepID=A0A975BB48_9BACT|nr:hypothetical protein [Desulfonema limicola]QTA82116.1 Uncharacterized protein dnl_44830 [Desulfonema limicola]